MRFNLSLLILLFQLITSIDVIADNTSGEINTIKRDAANYIYAESTMPTESEARSNADNLLITNITAYLEETQSDIQFSPIMAREFKYMKMMRGNDVRVFAYIAKSSLSSEAPESVAEVKNGDNESEEAVDDPQATANRLTSDQQQVINNLLRCNDMQRALKLLALFQSSQLIKDYGTRSSLPRDTAPYWIITDSGNQISTIISPEPDATDMKTGDKILDNSAINEAGYWFLMP